MELLHSNKKLGDAPKPIATLLLRPFGPCKAPHFTSIVWLIDDEDVTARQSLVGSQVAVENTVVVLLFQQQHRPSRAKGVGWRSADAHMVV